MNLLTTAAIAKMFDEPVWRVRYAIKKLGVESSRCGPSRAIPLDWLPAILDSLNRDCRNDRKKKKVKRPQPKL